MAKQVINIGRTANDRSGDPLRLAFSKINDNFTELYTLTGGTAADLKELAQDYAAEMFTGGTHSGITVTYNDSTNKINLTVPSIPTDVSDLTDTTNLLGGGTGNVRFSGTVISADADSSLYIGTVTTTDDHNLITMGQRSIELVVDNYDSQNSAKVKLDNSTAHPFAQVVVGNASSPKTWVFDDAGDLKLPAGGDILDSTGTSVLGSGGTDPVFTTVTATDGFYGEHIPQVGSQITAPFFAGVGDIYTTTTYFTLWMDTTLDNLAAAGDLTGWSLRSNIVNSNTVTITSYSFSVNGSNKRIDITTDANLTYTFDAFYMIFTSPDYEPAVNGPATLHAGGHVLSLGTDGSLTVDGNSVVVSIGDITFNANSIIGSGADSGDGNGYNTIKLVPDNSLYANDQYLIIDPTQPNHIHIRAGGTQDDSNAQLFLGGEKNHVTVQDNNGVYINNQITNSNTSYYNDGVNFTNATWYVDNGACYVQFTTTDPQLQQVILNFNTTVPDTVEVTDGTNSYILAASGYYSNLGNDEYKLGVVETPPDSITLNLTALTFTVYTTNFNEVYLANSDFRVDVADDVRIIASDLFRLTNNSTESGIEITTDDNNASHTWEFTADGNLTLPSTSQIMGDIVTVKGSSSVNIKVTSVLNPFETKDWGFDSVGRMSFPDNTLQTTAYTGRNPLTTVAKTGAVAPVTGEVSTVTLGTLNNTNLTPGIYAGLFLGLGNGFTVTVIVAENWDISVTVVSSNGGFVVGEQATIPGSVIGGTTGIDDLTVTVATLANTVGPTELDLTKAVQKLTDGYYSLADGVEGQVMHLVRQAGTTAANIYLNIANGRVNAASYTDILLNPFLSNSQGDMTTLLFTDNAWQSNNGQWD